MKFLQSLLLVWCVVFWCVVGAAAPGFRVQFTAAGPVETVTALERRTRELLRSPALQLEWDVTEHFRPRDVFEANPGVAQARIWLDARDVTRAVIYLVDDAHERFLVRVVPLEAGYDEVACESVGTIIESSVAALVDGVELGVDRQSAEQQLSVLEKPSAPATQRAAAPAPPTRGATIAAAAASARIGLELAYRTQVISSDPLLLHGPDVGLRWGSAEPGLSAFGFTELGYRIPVRWHQDDIGATLHGATVRLGPGLRWQSDSRLAVSALGLLGLNWLRVTPAAQAQSAVARDTLSVFAPTVGVALEAEVWLLGALSAALALGFDTDIFGNHLDVLINGRPEVVLEPWRIQPFTRLAMRATW